MHPLFRAIRRELEHHADSGKAGPMQAYMKSAMPYYGIQTPQLRQIWREVFPLHVLPDFESWRDTVLEIWRGARFREERYAAVSLTGHPLYERHQTLKSLPLYEELIVTGAWWDLVDGIASDRLGRLVRVFPAKMKPRMLRWSTDGDLWKRRSAILCQLGFKGDTDLDLLYGCILPNLADKEFFIRKAIGWALRQHAWTDPEEVRRFVREHEAGMSPLSRREALKNIG